MSSSPRRWHHDFTLLARESFAFQQPPANSAFCDWKAIDPINIDDIVANHDIDSIERLLPSLTHAPIGSLIHNRILDPNLRKYLQLAQLGLQYLLFCKKFLEKTLCGLRVTVEETTRDSSKLAKILKKKNEEIGQLQDKVKDMEKTQAMVVYSCNKCLKKFARPEAIDEHLRLEHAEDDARPAPPVDNNLINAIKLELEVKQLKERLNLAEKELHSQRQKPPEPANELKCVTTMVDRSVETCNLAHTSVQTDYEYELEPATVVSVKESAPELKEQASPLFSPNAELTYLPRLEEALQEQMQLIQSWRQSDRNMYREEIKDLQNGLKEVITSLESATKLNTSDELLESPEAPKQTSQVATSEKSQTRSQRPNLQGPQSTLQKPPHPEPRVELEVHEKAEENPIWEERFYKLEKIFFESQERMERDFKTLNLDYNDKLHTLERRLKESTTAQPVIREVQPFQSSLENSPEAPQVSSTAYADTVTDEDGIEEDEVLGALKRRDSVKMRKRGARGGALKSSKKSFKAFKEKTLSKSKLPVKIKAAPQTNTRKDFLAQLGEGDEVRRVRSSDQASTFESSQDVEAARGVERARSAGPGQASSLAKSVGKVSKKSKKSFGESGDAPVSKLSSKKSSSSENVFAVFKRKLFGLGIKEYDDGLSTKKMLAIKSQLATDRLKAKKENKLFASLRAKFNTKANKLAMQKLNEEKELQLLTDLSSPEDPQKPWRHKLSDKIDEETENSEDTSLSSDRTSLEVKQIETQAEVNPMLTTATTQHFNPRSSYPNFESFNLAKSQYHGRSANIDAALKKVLESPIRRPSLPASFSSQSLEIQPRRVVLKKVIFNEDLTRISPDLPLPGVRGGQLEVSVESCNESDEIQQLK